MTIEIVIPQVGEAVSEVTLVKWLKNEGDIVKKGEVLFEVDTDKAVVEVEAFAGGRLAQILAPANSPVMPQQVVGILTPVETASGETGDASSSSQTRPGPAADQGLSPDDNNNDNNDKVSPMARRVAAELGVDLNRVPGTGPGGRIKVEDVRQFAAGLASKAGPDRAPLEQPTPPSIKNKECPKRVPISPKARRLAKTLGIDLAGLAGLTGTGVDGLITVKDVQAAATASSPAPPAPSPMPAPPISITDQLDIQSFSKLRRTTAKRMQRSKQTVPHFYLTAEVDMTQAQHLRAYCRQTLAWERSPTYTGIIVRACALALAALPALNSFYPDHPGDNADDSDDIRQGLVQRQTVDIGLAVSVRDGLLTPVLPQANRLSLAQTTTQIRALVERARQGRLRAADLAQKSMVVSNLGMYGIDTFMAIIDIPNPMILAVGQVADRVVAIDGRPAVRSTCTLTLSADHRVLDGVQGAQFLGRVKDILEKPFEILGNGI